MKAPMIEIPRIEDFEIDSCEFDGNTGCVLNPHHDCEHGLHCPGPGKHYLIPADKARVEAVARVMYESDIAWFRANGPDDRLSKEACDISWNNGCYERKARAVLESLGVDGE